MHTTIVRCAFVLLLLLGLCALPAHAAEKTPDAVEAVIDALLQSAAGAAPPTAAQLKPLLDFARDPAVLPDDVAPRKRDQGTGIFARATFNVPFAKMLRYCYDPKIPGEALYPNVIRRHQWLAQSPFVKSGIKLWEEAKSLADGTEPKVYRAAETEEITPDDFSCCFYTYTLDRLMLLLRDGANPVLVSVGLQRGPSSVGEIGQIVGNDNQWAYVYSQKVGSNLSLAKWAETYMYSAATVTVLYPDGERRTTMALFKYLKAGWKGMNMVKPEHIAAGTRRFVQGFRQVIESPSLPPAESIAAKALELRAMDMPALQKAFAPQARALQACALQSPMNEACQELLRESKYSESLNKDELVAELLKLYMRKQLGKPMLAPGQ